MASAIVTVYLPEHSYDIEIGPGLHGRLGEWLRDHFAARRTTVIADETVYRLYGDVVGGSLDAAGFEYLMMTVPPGDTSKSLAIAAELYDELAVFQHGRDEPVVALGGGMVGDLAGFVAATWLRGVPCVQVPTTLEAMIDAAIGGKTALNHQAGKNLIGAFHQPAHVCIDVDCLKSLPDRDFVAGLAESVKHAVISGEDFLAWMERHAEEIRTRDPGIVAELIRRNCQIKAAIVSADEFESDTQTVGRAALNFGHTIGHAIEAERKYELRHGEAVALGIIAVMELSVRLTGLEEAMRQRVEALIKRFGLPDRLTPPLAMSGLRDRLHHDKKVQRRTVRFVLARRLGELTWYENVPDGDFAAAIERISDMSHTTAKVGP